jgi:F-type H+-transporting ATPase subunit O
VDSTPDNQPPSREDTIEGRYASVLFTYASQEKQLYAVFEDMKYLQELFAHCETFRMFTENQGVGEKEILALNDALRETAPFSEVTLKFLEVCATNKRLVFISGIADRYAKLYQEFNKEEKVTIISAKELTAKQKEDVVAALRANPDNAGKDFTVDYSVDDTILGGLQMYTESEFMDMSLASRLTRLSEEVKTMTA